MHGSRGLKINPVPLNGDDGGGIVLRRACVRVSADWISSLLLLCKRKTRLQYYKQHPLNPVIIANHPRGAHRDAFLRGRTDPVCVGD